MSPAVLAFSSIIGGAAAGTILSTLLVWFSLRDWKALASLADPRSISFAGTILGPIAAFVICWALSRGIAESWRRLAMAVTASFGAVAAGGIGVAVGMWAVMLPNPVVAGLLLPVYFALMVAVFVLAWRAARRQPA